MKKNKSYSNANDFRHALEDRLKKISLSEKENLQTLRKQVAFDRLLMRLFRSQKALPWALKGGYAIELRLDNSRATKDIDLSIRDTKLLSENSAEQNAAIQQLLKDYAEQDLADFFVFSVGDSMMDIEATPYGGARFPIEAKMDDRTFVKFHLDVGVGDVWIEPLESIPTRDWLSFASIESTAILAISIEQQFSEKIHAYTLPRGEKENSRVRDLVDMALLIVNKKIDNEKFLDSLKATFNRRNTHKIPKTLAPPPESWHKRFEPLANECELKMNIEDAFKMVKDFFDRANF